jgi:hypothetical protein
VRRVLRFAAATALPLGAIGGLESWAAGPAAADSPLRLDNRIVRGASSTTYRPDPERSGPPEACALRRQRS